MTSKLHSHWFGCIYMNFCINLTSRIIRIQPFRIYITPYESSPIEQFPLHIIWKKNISFKNSYCYAGWYGSEVQKALQGPMKSWCRAPLVYRSFASSRFLFARTYSYQARIILKVLSFKGLFLTIWIDHPNCCTRRI